MKIYVYAICKNEEQFVKRWVNSMKEADGIFVLDTGSKDKTVSKLKKLGVKVKRKKIAPWRFDIARNESLKLVPKDADICVCTDLDEVFKPGWRKVLEDNWGKNTTRARYTYNWFIDEFDNPKVTFYIEKIHQLNGYKWYHPVHEVLQSSINENVITLDEIILNHYPDYKKSRSSYLPLLELSVKEDPFDDRNMHYLGREYMYYKKWNEAIDTLIKHLNLKTSTWKDERSASMRFISRCYKNLGREKEARMWLDEAIKETPYLRDPYIERALLEYNLNNYSDVYLYCKKALEIKYHTKSYIHEVFSWDATIYDLLSVSAFYLKKYDESLEYINQAIKMDNTNERFLKNKILIENEIKKRH